MYLGVVRVFPVPQPVSPTEEPIPPVEKELARTLDSLKEGIERFQENVGPPPVKSVHTQTDTSAWSDMNVVPPVGYAVPKVFVRSAAEAIEQAVITYCPMLKTVKQREQAMMRLLQEMGEFVRAPRHLFFEIYETSPAWYDYVRISVQDHVTADTIAAAELIPPETRTILANVKQPLYDTPIVKENSIPHFPQVEVSFLRFKKADFTEEVTNRVVAQSVTVPLDLFVKASNVNVKLEDGTEREVSYKAALVRNDFTP